MMWSFFVEREKAIQVLTRGCRQKKGVNGALAISFNM